MTTKILVNFLDGVAMTKKWGGRSLPSLPYSYSPEESDEVVVDEEMGKKLNCLVQKIEIC